MSLYHHFGVKNMRAHKAVMQITQQELNLQRNSALGSLWGGGLQSVNIAMIRYQ